ncbi:uncharacterized protein LOC143794028 [Ranitomeya variabilis]|uniref:uncharacterized protein LOC143794028 n=1 Tax=Ranitomeya variabilis TaxID=490064 RepID=UPI004056DEA6
MTERRSTRPKKEASYKEYVARKTPARRAKPTYKKRRTLKFFLEQAAILPEIGDPNTEVDCRLYTTEEIEASLEMARQGAEKRIPNQEEIDAAVALMDLSRNWEERRAAEQAEKLKMKKKSRKKNDNTSKPPPKKRSKKNSDHQPPS